MVFAQECQPRREGLYYLIGEKRVEKYLALNLSNSKKKTNALRCVYSSKFFRIFYKPSKKNSLEISISKRFFRLAVDRNRTKRRIKEIFRALPTKVFDGVIVFSVFSPFGELSYQEALKEISAAIESVTNNMGKQ